jgi:outer membrane receptor protein involved in Fe transport
LTVLGTEVRDPTNPPGTPLAPGSLDGTPCTNVGNVVDGELVPRRSKGDGFTHRVNIQYKPVEDVMLYATWSRGFRPGGINRQPNAPAYDPDYLTNYELGWKTMFGPIRWNGAIYSQLWKGFQFSFLGENSLTVIQNGRDARVRGIETDVGYTGGGFTLNAAAAYTDAKTKGNICNFALGNEDCSGLDDGGDPDFIITPSGTRLPVTPKFKMAATGRYTWPLGVGRAHVQGGVSYQSSAASDVRQVSFACGPIIGDDICGEINPNDIVGRIRSSTLVDLFAGYDWNTYSVEIFAKNLFDARNDVSRFVVCSICTQNKIVAGRPRVIGLRLGARF